MQKLTINFSKDANGIDFENINNDIVDVSRVTYIKNIKYDFNIDSSLKTLYNIIDQIYQDEFIKNLKICDYPAYHLTAISQKHSEIHWLSDFCHFLTLIKLNARSFQKYNSIEIHAPVIIKENEEFIRNYLLHNEIHAKLNFVYHGKVFNIYNVIKACLIVLAKYLRFFFFFKDTNNKNNSNINDSIFITYLTAPDRIFLALKSIYTSKKEKISLIIARSWTDRSYWGKVDSNFSKNKPKLSLVFKIFYDVLKIFRLTKINIFEPIDIEGLKLNKTFLSIEIIKMTANQFCLETVINYHWLRMFLSMDNFPKKVFYRDEFYNFGKCVSIAKNNSINAKKIDSFGIQHGHINIYHTLYSLSALEAKSNFPAPDYFIVWSKYYQNMFNKNNISKVTKILPLGSLVHFDKYKKSSKNLTKFDNLKILWCLTDQYSFMTELNILKHSNLWKNSDIKIRQHPNSKFLEDSSYEKYGISNDMILNSSDHIFDQIKESDVIITTYYSTIIIDALINSKIVIALSHSSFKNSLEGSEINVCTSPSELDNLFQKTINDTKKLSIENQILSKLIIFDSSIFIDYFFKSKNT